MPTIDTLRKDILEYRTLLEKSIFELGDLNFQLKMFKREKAISEGKDVPLIMLSRGGNDESALRNAAPNHDDTPVERITEAAYEALKNTRKLSDTTEGLEEQKRLLIDQFKAVEQQKQLLQTESNLLFINDIGDIIALSKSQQPPIAAHPNQAGLFAKTTGIDQTITPFRPHIPSLD